MPRRRSSQPQQEDCFVCVSSYNILSPTYAESLQVADQKYINSQFRLERVLEKLRQLMVNCENEHDSSLNWIPDHKSAECKKTRPIFCLQEIGQSWTGELHKFFHKYGYHFMVTCYGNKSSDYFGVGMAFPGDRYDLIDAKFLRPADWKKWVQVDENRKSVRDVSLFGYFEECFLSMDLLDTVKWALISIAFFWCIWMYFLFKYTKFLLSELEEKRNAVKEEIPWIKAKERNNTMILAKLRCKRSRKSFVLSTYHMPCQFKIPQVMVIHSSLALQITQEFAQDLPYVLAGDFNFMKESSCYKLYSKGLLEKEDPDYPKLPALDSWTPDLKEPVQSAYSKILEGNEPKFTNLARHVGGDLFVGTLDYIFCSPSCEVLEVLRLSDIFDESSPYPNANEPSDHVMIASTVRI